MGDRLAFCRRGVIEISAIDGLRVSAISSLYETAPMDNVDQDPFYNAVVEVATSLAPADLLRRCQQIETRCGRIRTIAKGPRTLDLDLLAYHPPIEHEGEPTLPHPAMAERPFVLVPLDEIAPDFLHHTLNASPKQMLARLERLAPVTKIDDAAWLAFSKATCIWQHREVS